MTDLPRDPAEPTPDEPTPPPPAIPDAPAADAPPAAPPVPPVPPQSPPPPAAPYGGPPAAQPGYPPNPVGTQASHPVQPGSPAQSGYPAQPGYPVQSGYPTQPGYPQAAGDNPYGGYSQAPVYAGGTAYPGSLTYVEQNFGKVADFGQRALAYLIDFAINLIGLIPTIIGIIMLVASAPDLQTDELGNITSSGDGSTGLAVTGGLFIALGFVLGIGIWLWNRVFKMGRTGQSVGKKAIGLYLLDDKTGQPIGAGMCFLRELVQGLVNQIVYLGWLWMLWDADKQTLGDKSVHSNVVVLPKA
jgi:uncharacterized RDD family membrane protein YckC